MVPCPVALGLMVCEKIIVEEGTRNVTLVGCFARLRVDQFPTGPQRFAVYAVLRDGHGRATISLVATRLDTGEETYNVQGVVHFPDRLTDVHALFRVNHCSFPAPGQYALALLIDGELVAQRQIEVMAQGGQS